MLPSHRGFLSPHSSLPTASWLGPSSMICLSPLVGLQGQLTGKKAGLAGAGHQRAHYNPKPWLETKPVCPTTIEDEGSLHAVALDSVSSLEG